MKPKEINSGIQFFVVLLAFLLSACSQDKTNNYIQYIDVFIGTRTANSSQKSVMNEMANGQTIPAVTLPFGMTQWTPQVYEREKEGIAPYYHGGTMIQGFRASHWLSNSSTKDYGSFTIFPTRMANNEEFIFSAFMRQTMFLFKPEHTTPAYSSFLLPEKNIMTEITATKRCGFFRFSWLEEKEPTIIIDVNSDENKGYIKVDLDRNEIYGYNPVSKTELDAKNTSNLSGYFVARFSHSFVKHGIITDLMYNENSIEAHNKKRVGAYVSFNLKNNTPLNLKVGTSFSSIENARNNLNAEIPEWNFEATKKQAEDVWNKALGRIKIKTNKKEEQTKFYTALYHALLYPRLYSDVNGDYPSFGGASEIKNATTFNYYCDFLSAHTYRAQMPLLSLIAPEEYNDMVKSLIAKAEQGGWLPSSPMQNSYASKITGTGDYCTSIITDAAMKGFDLNLEKAYSYIRKNAFTTPQNKNSTNYIKGREALNSYLEFGYIPLENEALSSCSASNKNCKTLEYAYADWCAAQFASKLEKTEDYTELSARATNYTNIFDKKTGWINDRYGDGTFYKDLDAENKQHPELLYAPHDVEGLIQLIGSRDNLAKRISTLIDNNKYKHANSTSQHIPFLFNDAKQWSKTQETVKNLLNTKYSSTADGLSGNDNAGQLSAWYVFAAIGFYPTCPGSNTYQLSSPIFEEVILDLDKSYYPKGKFILKARQAETNPIFNKVKLNGKEIATSIKHENIKNGGKLEFFH